MELMILGTYLQLQSSWNDRHSVKQIPRWFSQTKYNNVAYERLSVNIMSREILLIWDKNNLIIITNRHNYLIVMSMRVYK